LKKFSLVTVLFFLGFGLMAQLPEEKTAQDFLLQKGEVYFSFTIPEGKVFAEVFNLVSVDNLRDNTVYAYANAIEFEQFLALNLDYQVLPHPGDAKVDLNMRTWEEIQAKDLVDTWDFSPTYEAYLSLMNSFQADFPELCEIHNIGTTVDGRSLLFAKISANVSQRENEPRFMYTSTIHGDETTGFIMMLRLIHYLLNNYASNDDIAYLLNNMEIWICPNENPDGTYTNNNSSVSGATRYNANGYDLNRNYPNPISSTGPIQPETQAMTAFVDTMGFVMSANNHGGIELVNFPFDTWTSGNPANRHADHEWWFMVSREFADTAQYFSPSGYMTAEDNGVTHGGDWYVAYGTRQDYLTYYAHGREVTLEISDTKLLPAAQLPAHWDYLHRSYLNYMRQALYGIRGTVKDAETGEPLEAQIEVLNHDKNNSEVFTSLPTGNFHRPILAGTYDLKVTADGYPPLEISSVQVQNYQTVVLDIELGGSIYADFTAEPMAIPQGGYVDFADNSLGDLISWEWTFEGGEPAQSDQQNPKNIIFAEAGSYTVSLTVSDGEDTDTRNKQGFINVLPVSQGQNHNMSNATVATCGGNFYDPGGPTGQYSNNQDYTMAFVPATQGDRLKFTFSQFALESHSSCNYDWLKIFDGPNTDAPLIGTYCGTNSPGVVTSSHATGALTFQFHSDFSQTEPGWAAAISCEPYSRRLFVDITGEGDFDLSGTPLSGTNPYVFAFGQEITIQALPASNANFVEWIIDGESITLETIQLEMIENIRAELVFAPLDGPVAVFDPLSLTFGPTPLGAEDEQELTISNTGNQLLTVNFEGFTGDPVFFLDIPTRSAYEIAPGASQVVPLYFISEEEGDFTGQANFSTNDPNLTEVSISLAGNAILEAAVLLPITSSLNFGQVLLGESATLSLNMKNNGNAALEITGLSFTDNVFSTSETFPLTLEAGADFALDIVFTPSAVGTSEATLGFVSNALNNDDVLIPLIGSGYSNVSTGDLQAEGFSARLYPNPVREHTLLEINLIAAGRVSVELFDLSGARIDVLYEGMLEAGTSHIELPALNSRMQQGVFLIRVSHPNGIRTIRLINLG
jgi:PKD repeat protein